MLKPLAQTQVHHQPILSSLCFPFQASPQGSKETLRRGFHTMWNLTLISNVSFPSNRCGISQSTPLVQRLCWRIARCLALIPFVTAKPHRQQILFSLGFFLSVFPSRFLNALVRKSFPYPFNECLFPSPTIVGSHIVSFFFRIGIRSCILL